MIKPLTALIIVITALHINACSLPIFHSSQEKDSAKISFSSMSTDVAELSISLRGKSYSISHDMFEKRRPRSAPSKLFNIPGDEEITISYNIFEISDITYTPTVKYSVNPYLGSVIDIEEHYTLNTCSKQLIFRSEKNKQYEVFVERAAQGRICQIYIKEVAALSNNTHKTFKRVKTKTLFN